MPDAGILRRSFSVLSSQKGAFHEEPCMDPGHCSLCALRAAGQSAAAEDSEVKALPPIPLSLNEVHAWIDRSPSFAEGGRVLKNVGTWENAQGPGSVRPVLVNDTEIERFVDKGTTKTQSVGFNDTLVEARTPLGFRGSAGVRQAIGDAKIPDPPLAMATSRSFLAASCLC